jgi:hypothetical protein
MVSILCKITTIIIGLNVGQSTNLDNQNTPYNFKQEVVLHKEANNNYAIKSSATAIFLDV